MDNLNRIIWVVLFYYGTEEEMIYQHTDINMSKEQLSAMLYWCIMFDVVITATHTLGYNYTRKQNSRNTAWIVLGFKDEKSIDKFKAETGFKLSDPPQINLNQT